HAPSYASEAALPSRLFHCEVGDKQEKHFSLTSSRDRVILQIQETDDGGVETDSDGREILLRQLGATTVLGHQYLLTLELSDSPSSTACTYQSATPLLFACNPSKTQLNVARAELKDLSGDQVISMDVVALVSVTSTLRTDIQGIDGSAE